MHIEVARLIARGARVLALAAIMIARAAAADDDAVREYVDEITAVSITVPVESLLFARERTDLAANARDYITLTPLEINRTGQRACYWFGYVWSTIDRRNRQPLLLEGDELVLLADGRPIALKMERRQLRDLGVGEPPTRPPVRGAVPVLFAATPEEIAYVARAREVHVELIRGGENEPFPMWKDARDSVQAFVDRVDAAR